VSACRSCGAPVQWGRVEPSGKAIPLDPEPTATGNLVVVRATYGAHGELVPVVRYVGADTAGERFVSHFVTCPDADQWRSR
jgi:hypothetical protein